MIVDKIKGKEKAPAKGGIKLDDAQEADADLATAIGVRVMHEPDMMGALEQLLGSAEPVMAMGQFISQLVMNIKEKSDQSGMPIDDMVWMAKGGVVDRLIDQASLLAETFGVDMPASAEPAVMQEVMNVIKLAGSAGQGGGQPQPQGAPVAGPPSPQGSPMGRDTGGMV
jgi:hypothetical protein